jgi:predicted nucleic acid-binding protein
MAVTLLDTSAVIAFLYRDDQLHEAAAAAVRSAGRRGGLAVSVITVAELLTGVERGHHAGGTIEEFLQVAAPTHYRVENQAARAAAFLRGATPSLRMPDALILATAQVTADVDSVITGDARWAKLSLDLAVDLLQA